MKEKIVGHEAVETGETVIIVRRTERPLGMFLGLIFGAVLSFILSREVTSSVMIVSIVFAMFGWFASKGSSTIEIQKHRVISITRGKNYAAVYYLTNKRIIPFER